MIIPYNSWFMMRNFFKTTFEKETGDTVFCLLVKCMSACNWDSVPPIPGGIFPLRSKNGWKAIARVFFIIKTTTLFIKLKLSIIAVPIIITFVRWIHENGDWKNRVHREMKHCHYNVYQLKTEKTTTTIMMIYHDNNANQIAAINVAITITLLLLFYHLPIQCSLSTEHMTGFCLIQCMNRDSRIWMDYITKFYAIIK